MDDDLAGRREAAIERYEQVRADLPADEREFMDDWVETLRAGVDAPDAEDEEAAELVQRRRVAQFEQLVGALAD